MKETKENRLTELSDVDFLSFLYSERDREERLNTYQGWNNWAIAGAVITIVCAVYSILCANLREISWLQTGYMFSGIISFVFSFRGWALFFMMFLERNRGVDFRKVKYLKDVAPIPYLVVALFCSVGFAIFFPLMLNGNSFGLISLLWMWIAVAYIIICFNLYICRNNIVHSFFDGMTFPDVRLWILFEASISVISSIVMARSFIHINGSFIGSSEFELAVCFVAIVFLLYLMLKIKLTDRKTSQIDVLLDDFIYKGRNKDDVFRQLSASRMGYGIIEVCAQELFAIKQSFDNFEPQKKQAEDILADLLNRKIDVGNIPIYFETLSCLQKYIDKCSRQAKSLNDKLKQILDHMPIIEEEEFSNLSLIAGAQLSRAEEILYLLKSAIKELQNICDEYGCKKYGGLCMKEYPRRHEKMSIKNRVTIWLRSSSKVFTRNLIKD